MIVNKRRNLIENIMLIYALEKFEHLTHDRSYCLILEATLKILMSTLRQYNKLCPQTLLKLQYITA
ncbi:hypothetical protein BH18THE2_BH18THE2_24220 [soil metagenome]